MDAIIFTSDVHLSHSNFDVFHEWVGCIEKSLSLMKASSPAIYILGDYLDLHIEGSSYFKKRNEPFITQLEIWRQKGVRVEWFEGNHDLYRPHLDQCVEVAGHHIYTCHGDLINDSDTPYLRLKKTLHWGPIPWILQKFPGQWLEALGTYMSHQSKEEWVKKKTWDWDHYRACLQKRLPDWKRHRVDTIVFGHCHWKQDESLEEVRVINLGFFPLDKSVFVIDKEGARWVGPVSI